MNGRPAGSSWSEVVLAMVVVSCAACSAKDEPVHLIEIEGPVTYTQDIRPILESVCMKCHSTTVFGDARHGAPSKINFDTYELARANAELADPLVEAGVMPPPSGLPFDQRDLFHAWVSQGTPH